jgi:cell division protein FtsQ
MLSVANAPIRRLAVAAGLIAVGGSAPWWGTRTLSTLAFFRVRAVEVEGAHYVSPQAVVDRLAVDTLTSVWSDLGPLTRRVRGMPGVREVTVARSLPSTLVVRVAERTPVAFVPTATGLHAYDGVGASLPIDPTREDLDLPVVERSDVETLRLLANLREIVPTFYAEISQVRRGQAGDLIFELPGLRVLASYGTDAQRFAMVPLVAADLARRKVHPQELDLRFRDQVVARLQ